MPTKYNRYTHSSGADVLGRRAGIPAYVLASELVLGDVIRERIYQII